MDGSQALWANQERGIRGAEQAEADGHKATCVYCPTGGGKTVMMAERARRIVAKGGRPLILTHRRTLLRQGVRTLVERGLTHSVLAPGFSYDETLPVCVGSVKTLVSRCLKAQKVGLPPATHVLVDEPHSNSSGEAEQLLLRYMKRGAILEGYDATPVGIGHIYQALVLAGTKAELRKAGKLVSCEVYAPDEPNMVGVKTRDGEFVEGQMRKRVMETLVFGNLFDNWETLNPDCRATLVWAPGVEESRWIVEMFGFLGVTAEHLDGNTSDSEREDMFGRFKDGRLTVISSYGVLREGVDLPNAYHGVLLQTCGAFATYMQLVGRLLRAADGKDKCILQDHSGGWWRHGSPNADYHPRLTDTNRVLAAERTYAFETRGEVEPQRCPNCNGIRAGATQKAPCPHCGHVYMRSVRLIRMEKGNLVKQVGNVHKRKEQGDDDVRVWKQCLWAAACCNDPHTLAQAAADFRRRQGKSLPPDLPLQPEPGSLNWYRAVPAVYPFIGRKKESARDPGPVGPGEGEVSGEEEVRHD